MNLTASWGASSKKPNAEIERWGGRAQGGPEIG